MIRLITTASVIALSLIGNGLSAQLEKSEGTDSVLEQARKISAATGRPIFAVAGQST